MRTFLVVDANNVIMKAIFAVHYRQQRGHPADPAPEPAQTAAGALDLFVAMLGRHVRAEAPERIALCWDPAGPSFRSRISADYKANRARPADPDAQDSAFALAKEFTYLAGIPNVAAPGLEADDLVAGFWAGAPPQRVDKLVILSDDRDFAQLIGSTPHGVECEQVRPSGRIVERVTPEIVRATWGCDPHQVPMVRAMAGDTSDNVIGIRGIGPKKAVKHLAATDWDFEQTLARFPEAERVRVRTNLALVDLRNGADPLPPPAPFVAHPEEHAHVARAAEMLAGAGLDRTRSQLLSGELWAPRQDDLAGAPLDLEVAP